MVSQEGGSSLAANDVPAFEGLQQGWVYTSEGDYVWGRVAPAPDRELIDPKRIPVTDQLGLAVSGVAQNVIASHTRILTI